MPNETLIYGVGGVLLCLFGFSLYMAGLRAVGMFLGGSIGALIGLVAVYLTHSVSPTSLFIILGAALFGMIMGASLLKGINGILALVLGAGLGFFLGKTVLPSFGPAWSQPWVPFAAGAAGAVLSGLLFRYIIILVTSGGGAYLLFLATNRQTWVLLVAFAIGLLVQIGLFHRLGLHKKVPLKGS